ncbi:MAG: efflux RND transporter periplasmic adaptor subunit [Flavobacteriales bacterium]
MRKIIIVAVGVILLVGANFLSQQLSSSKKAPKQKVEKVEKTVFVNPVVNKTIPIQIIANGNLLAKDKLELFTEVQGVLQYTGKEFRSGIRYNKGQTILKINNDEFYASILAQRSALENLIASIMPDIRLDHSASFLQWDTYLKAFDINKTTPLLPEPLSTQEKLFISAKNIFTTYYNIKNLEQRLGKYAIKAPFTGIITEANVNKGALVRSGQKLGEFINPSVYELELSVNGEYASLLKTGQKVALNNLSHTKSWIGKISRINGRIDLASQTVQVYVEVKGEHLKEGMYLEAKISSKEEPNVIEIDRKLLIENKAVYIVKNNVLKSIEIKPVHFNENTVIIKGLENGTQLISTPIPGAYDGMPVKIFSDKNTTKQK